MQVVVFDYGASAPQRLAAALRRASPEGATLEVTLTSEPEGVRGDYALVLPDKHDDALSLERGVREGAMEFVRGHHERGRPLLAVGFGLQLLLSGRTHEGMPPGLGLFRANNAVFDPRMADEAERPLKVPHVGYSFVVGLDRHPTLRAVVPEGEQGAWFYFRHRLCAPARVPFAEVAVAHHGVPFAGAIWKDSLLALQFLPELSGNIGIEVLRRWIEQVSA